MHIVSTTAIFLTKSSETIASIAFQKNVVFENMVLITDLHHFPLQNGCYFLKNTLLFRFHYIPLRQ